MVEDAGSSRPQLGSATNVPPNLIIESDTSHLGWGAVLKNQELKTKSLHVVTQQAGGAYQLSGVIGSIFGISDICQEEKHEYTYLWR